MNYTTCREIRNSEYHIMLIFVDNGSGLDAHHILAEALNPIGINAEFEAAFHAGQLTMAVKTEHFFDCENQGKGELE